MMRTVSNVDAWANDTSHGAMKVTPSTRVEGENTPAVLQSNAMPVTSKVTYSKPATENRVSPFKARSFGEEISTNFVIDTSMVTSEYRDSTSIFEDTDDCSDCRTESSSVAMFRERLTDRGKQGQGYHQKNMHSSSKQPVESVKEKRIQQKLPPVSGSVGLLPPQAANRLVKRMIDAPVNRDLPRSRPRTTPVRFKPKVNSDEVQATNEGYASVAKLSAWLADDPTKKNKVLQLRRGANIIAKSRAFDKGLADVIIDQERLPRGHVAKKANFLDAKTGSSALTVSESGSESGYSSVDLKRMVHFADQEGRPSNGVSKPQSVISVSDKRQWLANAFEKKGSSILSTTRAQTDIVTSQEHRDALSSRAKELWRSKRTPTKEPSSSGRNDSNDLSRIETSLNEVEKTRGLPSDPCNHTTVGLEGEQERLPDFQSARQILVQRAKANGNAVDVASKVQLRKAKFERLEMEVRRKSSPHGLLKPSWEETEDGRSSMYVKKYVADVAPKKSWDELP